jgi:hypothetical protein
MLSVIKMNNEKKKLEKKMFQIYRQNTTVHKY